MDYTRKKISAIPLLCIFAFSFLLMAPMTSMAFGEEIPESLGFNQRIEFLDSIIKVILDNKTRADLASHLLFNNRVMYFTANSSQSVNTYGLHEEFYGLIYTGLQNDSHRVYLRTNASLTVTHLNFSQYLYVNFILWDNDRSLTNFLVELNNATLERDNVRIVELLLQIARNSETVLTGDEIFIIVPVYLWVLNFDVGYQIDNQFIIDVNNNGPYDEFDTANEMDFSQLAILYPALANQLNQKATTNPALSLLMNDTNFATKKGSYSNFFYLIQQIWLKKLYFYWNSAKQFNWDIDIVSVRHLLFRVALYNDSNQNGLMDISFNRSANGFYYPYSTETISMLDLVNATSLDFGKPIIDQTPGSESIKWNATIKDPFVRLNPYGESSETGLLVMAPIVPVGDSSFGFTFRPQAVTSGNTVDLHGIMKIDQTFGALNGTGGLRGIYKNLDLSVIYLADVFELKSASQISASSSQTNATAENAAHQEIPATVERTSSITKSLEFFVGLTPITDIELAGTNYSIDNEDPTNPTHVANAAVIPYALYQHTIDQTGEITRPMGQVDWNVSLSVTYNTYLYEISYPDYNGSKIVHDPTYTILASITYPSGGGIPGFEFFSILLAFSILGCIVLYLQKKKAIIKI